MTRHRRTLSDVADIWWYQANVMLSYPVAEAEDLLQGKLTAAKESLENCEEDLDFLRQQITVRSSWEGRSLK